MATLNSLDLARPTIGQQAPIARATLTAVAGDATANTFNVDFASKLKAIDSYIMMARSSTGQVKALITTVSGSVVTISDGGTDVIATGDLYTVWAEGPLA